MVDRGPYRTETLQRDLGDHGVVEVETFYSTFRQAHRYTDAIERYSDRFRDNSVYFHVIYNGLTKPVAMSFRERDDAQLDWALRSLLGET